MVSEEYSLPLKKRKVNTSEEIECISTLLELKPRNKRKEDDFSNCYITKLCLGQNLFSSKLVHKERRDAPEDSQKSSNPQDEKKVLENLKTDSKINKFDASCRHSENDTHNQNTFNVLWQHRYNELVEFKNQNGHCHVPQRYHLNRSLGKWVHKQRQEVRKMRNGEKCCLNAFRMEALKSIGFESTANNRAESLWQKRYNELVDFKELYGHCHVPQKYPRNAALGKWVHRQRHEFKKVLQNNKSFLTLARIEALNAIGFLRGVNQDSWDKRLKELTEFKTKYGHCNVPLRYHPNKSLGQWVSKQRQDMKLKRGGGKSPLNDKRLQALHKIGFEFSLRCNKEQGLQRELHEEIQIERFTSPFDYVSDGKWEKITRNCQSVHIIDMNSITSETYALSA